MAAFVLFFILLFCFGGLQLFLVVLSFFSGRCLFLFFAGDDLFFFCLRVHSSYLPFTGWIRRKSWSILGCPDIDWGPTSALLTG